jgi:hypothetical protein
MKKLACSLLAYLFCVSGWGAEINVRYHHLPDSAMQGFNQAVQIWQNCLISPAPIKISVTGIEREPTGFAVPRLVRNQDHLPKPDTYYPSALSNAMSGKRDNEYDDMHIFMSLRTNWFYAGHEIATDQTDFINVALHEIAHGLGISSGSFIPWQGEKIASIGLPNDYINYFQYSFPLAELDGTPQIYGRFIRTASGKFITEFTNPSKALAKALTTSGIYFDGEHARQVNQKRVLVTPGNISHVPHQEGILTPIMLADSGKGESIHQPDPLLLAMLQDIGWQIAASCYQQPFDSL